ncbi:MAG: hypothetical protein JWO89_307, partial [Verrucomicrobiaceae bacterium]|nr:hypothetical protein [Verrucomicrobiaceae bacterium]
WLTALQIIEMLKALLMQHLKNISTASAAKSVRARIWHGGTAMVA